MTTHRTDKTTQHKKENLKPKRNIYRIERDAFYMHQVTQCGENPHFLKSLNQKNMKLLYFLLNLTKAFLFLSFSKQRFLLYKTCNTGYKHISILYKNYSQS